MPDPITFTVTPSGQERSLTINLTELLERLQTVPDQRKRRGVRYPLAVLLAIAVLAKLCGQSQVHALAGWAHTNAPPNSPPSLASNAHVCRIRLLGHAFWATPSQPPRSKRHSNRY